MNVHSLSPNSDDALDLGRRIAALEAAHGLPRRVPVVECPSCLAWLPILGSPKARVVCRSCDVLMTGAGSITWPRNV